MKKKTIKTLYLKDKMFKLVALKSIKTKDKVIYIDEIKNNFKILVSDLLIKEPSSISSISIKDKKVIIGDLELPIKKATRLNIEKKLVFIEEYEDGFRLTFSTSLVKNAKDINFQIGV